MTEKILIIAEKPSVAADIVKVLPDKFTKTKTHYEGDRHIVSFAIGHLVSICYPEEIDPAYQKWDIANLPILPEKFPLKELPNTKKQLHALQKLILREDVIEIINACDAGREGELIFKYIIQYVWNTSVGHKTFKRLWLQSMTSEAIKNNLARLRSDKEMLPLGDTALCRSESDWLIGINATRALTGFNSQRGGFFLTPCGRVQTPTLSLIVKRERTRQGFVPRPYSTLLATFTYDQDTYQGKWIDPHFAREKNDEYKRADRIWEKEKAEAVVAACTGRLATVEETNKKTTQRSPQLFDLTSLQREANIRFGISAQKTLSIAQSLYERHKVLTYPRTDSRHLPEDYNDIVTLIVKSQTNWQFSYYAAEALEKGYIQSDKRIFNNGKISDHHAIIPTTTIPAILSEPEMKIYRMVVQRFLAIFFPQAVYINTRRISVVGDETFLSEGKILLESGWKIIYGKSEENDRDTVLNPIPNNATICCIKIDQEEQKTTPPPRYTEATLLSAMENSDKFIDDDELADAMKERGLGTPATRAAIIEKLIKEKYVVREGKDLMPTGKAFDLLALLEAMQIDVLASPEMTGEWELKLNKMLKGEFSRQKFMEEIRNLTCHIISQVKNFENDATEPEASFSPVADKRFFSSPTAYISEDRKIRLRKVLGGRMMAENEIVALIEGKTLGPFNNFRSKKGKSFTASIRLSDNKIDFLFAEPTNNLDLEAIRQGDILGISPIDGTPVYGTPTAYMSESALTGDNKNGLRINRIILEKPITAQHIRQLLEAGKTELIPGFISKKKRPFEAYLLLSKNGKVTFEFPPRTPKKQQK